jgi:peroxin-7
MFKSDQSACAVQFSPFVPGRLAVATSQNFGVVGNGRVTIVQQAALGLEPVVSFDTVDGMQPLYLIETVASVKYV